MEILLDTENFPEECLKQIITNLPVEKAAGIEDEMTKISLSCCGGKEAADDGNP